MQKIVPSIHLLEIFMPATNDENYLIQKILPEVAKNEFYKGIELPVIFDRENQKRVRQIVDDKQYQLTIWASPNINNTGCSMSDLDPVSRKKALDTTLELMKESAETGAYHMGLPSGPDVKEEERDDAKKALFESFCKVSEEAKKYDDLHIILEPLDRYVHKKQLMGPIHEVIDWFKLLKQECPNFYIHWDSAHESLAGIDLEESLRISLPYTAQFHICNCITDPTHPCYGDWHMEVGDAPEYKNEGYLDKTIAANMLKQAASGETPYGIKEVHVAIEVRTHMGDDMWKREREIRRFLMDSMDVAGIAYDK